MAARSVQVLLLGLVLCCGWCSGNKVYDDNSSSAAVFEDVEAALALKSSDRSIVYFMSLARAADIMSMIKESSLGVTDKDVFCFDLSSQGDDVLNDLNAVATARSSSSCSLTFLVVSGAELLSSEKEVGKLNFLHSVTDANSLYANVVVILTWDTNTASLPQSSDMEDFLLKYFLKGGAKMNPNALLGRISSVFVGSSDSEPNTQKVDFHCQPHENISCDLSQSISHESDSGAWSPGNVLRVILMVGVLIWFFIHRSSSDSTPNASTGTRPVVASNSKTPEKNSKTNNPIPRRSSRKKSKTKFY